MSKSARSKAQQHFAPSQKKKSEFLRLKEEGERKRTEKVARLRALRLEKEAAELDASAAAPVAAAPKKKPAAKRKKAASAAEN